MENSENEAGVNAEIQPQDLQLNFSGDNKTSTLFISYKDCSKVAEVIAKILTEYGIVCRVVHGETPKTDVQ